jgi:V/A-type H+-transporting ATPase subunit D
MPSTTINPTRQELNRLKNRLRTSMRGHKLLKDKRDELMKQFMDVVRENRALRKRVEEGLMRAHGSFTVAAALMSPEMLEQSLLYPKQSVELDMTFQNIMSVDVPRYQFRTSSQDPGEVYPYGFAQTSGELDDAVDAMSQVFQDMLRLAEVEKTSQLLAGDRKDTPPGQRPGVCQDSGYAGQHQVYHYEAGRERAVQHHPPDEGEGHDFEGVHRGKESRRR